MSRIPCHECVASIEKADKGNAVASRLPRPLLLDEPAPQLNSHLIVIVTSVSRVMNVRNVCGITNTVERHLDRVLSVNYTKILGVWR